VYDDIALQSRCASAPRSRYPFYEKGPINSTAQPLHRLVQQRVPAMMAYAVSEGRLFWLKPSEWSVLLVSVAFCGFLTLLF